MDEEIQWFRETGEKLETLGDREGENCAYLRWRLD